MEFEPMVFRGEVEGIPDLEGERHTTIKGAKVVTRGGVEFNRSKKIFEEGGVSYRVYERAPPS